MRHPWKWFVPVAVVLLGAGVVAQEQPGQPREPRGALKKLDLSEDQQERIRALMQEQRPQLRTLHEKLSANRDALNQLLETGSADAAAVGELVLEGRKLQEESRAIREAGQQAIRGILTPEQQKKFDQLEQRRREDGSRGRGHAGGKRGGSGASEIPGMPISPRPGPGAPPPPPR